MFSQQRVMIRISLHLYFCSCCCFTIVILVGVKGYLIVVLILHLTNWLLSWNISSCAGFICVPSMEKCLLKSFDHFLNCVLCILVVELYKFFLYATRPFIDMWLADYFLQFGRLFHLCDNVLQCTDMINSDDDQFILSFPLLLLGSWIKIQCQP